MNDQRPPTHAEQSLRLLSSINDRLGELVKMGRANFGPPVADDDELDGKYGDPVFKYNPTKDWAGKNFAGQKMSACSPEYLDAQAKALDVRARIKAKENDGKGVFYAEKDAALARGWARRKRAQGWTPPPKKPPTNGSGNPWKKEAAPPAAPPPPATQDDDDLEFPPATGSMNDDDSDF